MRRLFLLSVFWLVALTAAPAEAQTIRLAADETALETVLRQLAVQADVDIVFAQRIVEDRAVTGRYIGDDVERALATVLRGSDLRADRLRAGQYVIVADYPTPYADPEPYRGTLSGTVVDAEANEVLPGAHIVLVGLGVGTATNAAGYFAIPDLPAGAYRVRVSFVGYRTADLELSVYPESSEVPPTVRLRPQVIAGGEAVVESSEDERSDLLPVPGTDALDVRQASATPAFLGESDLFQALEWLPGVGRSGEVGGELVIRGSDAHFNRYLLDGAPIIHPWHTFGLFSTFQTEALKGVRLYKGSFPAEYGGGLSAVLDVEMKDGDREDPAGTVALSPVSIRSVAEVPLGRGVSLMLSGRRSYLDLLFTPRLRTGGSVFLTAEDGTVGEAELGTVQEFGYYFYDVGAKLTLRPSRFHRLSVSYYEGGDSFDVRETYEPFGASPIGLPGLRLGYGWGNQVASVRYRALLGRRFFLTTTGYYSHYGTRESADAEVASQFVADSEYRVDFTELGANVDIDLYLSLEHQVRVGARLVGRLFESTLGETAIREDTGAGILTTRRDEVQALEVVAYVQDTWQPSPSWQIQPGVRVEVFGLGPYVSVSPRLHVRHVVAPGVFATAGLSRQVQYLHRLRDRYAFSYDLAASRWIPASEDVRPAVAWQVSAGLDLLPTSWLTLGIDAYGRQLTDILLPDGEAPAGDVFEGGDLLPGGLLAQYAAGAGRSFGMEVAAEAERGRWRYGLSYAYGRSQVKPRGEVYRRNDFDVPHTVKATVQGVLGRWTVAFAGTLRSGYPVTVPVARYALGDVLSDPPIYYLARPETNNGRLPAYARVDLALGYTFRLFGLAWDANVQAYNLFNRRNTVGLVYNPEPPSVAATDVQGLPIVPMISLKAAW